MVAVFGKPFKPHNHGKEPILTGVTYLDLTDPNDVGQRVDNFLLRHLKGVPRQRVYRLLRKGEVRVNGGRVKATYRLQMHDRVRIPPVRQGQRMPLQISQALGRQLVDSVLYEDEDYLVIDKPAGVAVHGDAANEAGVVEILRETLDLPRLELVHRIDRHTSGCLALAKNRLALQAAQQQFRLRRVKKIYDLFVVGAWEARVRTIQARLTRYTTDWGERRVKVDPSGRQARTDVVILDQAGALATRLQASLHTGRTHQIRVHVSSHNHPILGDDRYALRHQAGGADLAACQPPRMCLHASRLVIPLQDRELRVVAPLDPVLTEYWAALKQAAAG